MRRPSLLLLSLAVAAFAGCAQHAAIPAKPDEPTITPGEIGSRLPEFSVKDLQGHEISSTELRGKVVLVRWWTAPDCPYCGATMKDQKELSKHIDQVHLGLGLLEGDKSKW